MRIVCVSDTHNQHQKVDIPEGDVLVHAGDFSMNGRPHEIHAFAQWMGDLPHRHKIVVAGNHDWFFDCNPWSVFQAQTYLEDTGTTIEGVTFWGSPWQPEFADWAFNLPRGPELAAKWALVPTGVDVLITHSPPMGIGDRNSTGQEVGCEDLRAALGRIRPRLHIFGHIHEAYGRCEQEGSIFVNAAICDESYRPLHAPIVVDL